MDRTPEIVEAGLDLLQVAALSGKLNGDELAAGTPAFERGLRIMAERVSDEQWAELEAQLLA